MAKSKQINKPFNYKGFADAVIAYRLDNDMYQKDMGALAGVSGISIFRAESQNVLDLDTIRKICNTIGVAVQTFL